jgi:hypothetical protein
MSCGFTRQRRTISSREMGKTGSRCRFLAGNPSLPRSLDRFCLEDVFAFMTRLGWGKGLYQTALFVVKQKITSQSSA